jgi:hypothetical protein
MSRAARRRWLCLLAVLFLAASVALSARLLVAGSVAETPGASHYVFTPAPEKAQPAASDGRSTDRPQDRPSPDSQQPAGLEESKDGSAKKLLPAFAVLFAPFEVRDEYAGWKPGPAAVEGGSDDPPPQLLQRPPPAG